MMDSGARKGVEADGLKHCVVDACGAAGGDEPAALDARHAAARLPGGSSATIHTQKLEQDSGRTSSVAPWHRQPLLRPPITAVAMNKPRGVVCTAGADDPLARSTVYDILSGAAQRGEVKLLAGARCGMVGRLDADTSGLLLMIDDARLSAALRNKEYAESAGGRGCGKTYRLRLRGAFTRDDDRIQRLEEPLRMPGKGTVVTLPARVLGVTQRQVDTPRKRDPSAGWITDVTLELFDGKNRQIRRLCKRSGLNLLHLHRLSVGIVDLGDLTEGHCRHLTPQEVAGLYESVLPRAIPPPLLHIAGVACLLLRIVDDRRRRLYFVVNSRGRKRRDATTVPASSSPRDVSRLSESSIFAELPMLPWLIAHVAVIRPLILLPSSSHER